MGFLGKNTILSRLTAGEKQTFFFHLAFASLEGIILGAMVLNEFVFIESLRGSNYQVSILFTFTMAVFILLLFTNEFIKRSRNKRKLLLIGGTVTRIPLLFMFLFPSDMEIIIRHPIYHYIFLAVFLVFYLGNTIIRPSINLFLKNSYRHELFGLLFGYVTTIQKIFLFVATLLFGIMLDTDHYAFVYVYPVLGVIGIAGIFILSRISYQDDNVVYPKTGIIKSVGESVRTMYRILHNDKPYFFFEAGFMFYGIAFMTTVSVITIYMSKQLDLNYTSIAFYKNANNIIAIILLPFFGSLIGKADPRKFGVLTFASLLLYLLFMMISEYTGPAGIISGVSIYTPLIVSFLFLGVFTAAMHLLWNIGSAYFCERQEAGIYQSVHLSLTSVRAIIAPVLGIAIYEIIGYTWTFVIGMIFLLLGIIILIWSGNKYKITVKQ